MKISISIDADNAMNCEAKGSMTKQQTTKSDMVADLMYELSLDAWRRNDCRFHERLSPLFLVAI